MDTDLGGFHIHYRGFGHDRDLLLYGLQLHLDYEVRSPTDVDHKSGPDNGIEYPFFARLYYVHEVFVSRKFNENIALQLVPVIVHRNLVSKRIDQNIVPAVGLGGMYKITEKLTLVGEYYYLLPGQTADDYENTLSIGIEIETSGHVFQLDLSNSHGMTEKLFVPETTGNWLDGDIHFGFNVVRYF